MQSKSDSSQNMQLPLSQDAILDNKNRECIKKADILQSMLDSAHPVKNNDNLVYDLSSVPSDLKITIQGAREHNLKNVSLQLPRNRMIVFTGLSGSGKSSLAFDTLFAEGQRRYVESLSAYARQFLGRMDKPDVDFIEGLSPAVSIDQKNY